MYQLGRDSKKNQVCISHDTYHIPSKIIGVLAVQMSSGHVDHHEHRYQSFGRLRREDEEHEIDDHRTDELMDPLNSNRKLKQEGSEYEGEQMLHLSVWEGEHNQSQRIANEHPEQIFECFDILASRLSKRPDRIFHECRHC